MWLGVVVVFAVILVFALSVVAFVFFVSVELYEKLHTSLRRLRGGSLLCNLNRRSLCGI